MVGCSRSIMKDLIGVLQVVLGNKRFLMRFQDGCENNMSSNQLTIVIVDDSVQASLRNKSSI